MTDRGRFERLATSVLRKDNKDYQTIIHTGVNAQGETVTSPLDGFCLVPASSPPRFLLVEHTTTDKSRLERKWLHDTSSQGASKASESDDGDLVKAGRETRQLRIDHPDAAFTVVLTTNQRPSTDLLKKVYKKAKELGVTCDVWDQSRLADLLDSTPEGQWLRKEHLGIEAEMLSPSLLRELCEQA